MTNKGVYQDLGGKDANFNIISGSIYSLMHPLTHRQLYQDHPLDPQSHCCFPSRVL